MILIINLKGFTSTLLSDEEQTNCSHGHNQISPKLTITTTNVCIILKIHNWTDEWANNHRRYTAIN